MEYTRTCLQRILLLLTLSSLLATAKTTSEMELTKDEQLWLQQHSSIVVQNEANFPPFNFNNGAPAGFSVDYIKLLGSKLGLKVRFIENVTWSQGLDLFNQRKLDVIANISYSKERAKTMLFTKPSLTTFSAIYVPINGDSYPSPASLVGKTVAVPKGYLMEDLLRRYYPDINLLPTKDTITSIQAVLDGKAVATMNENAHFSYLLRENKINGLRLGAMIEDKRFSNSLYFAVHEDNNVLRNLLNKAIDSVTDEEYREIYERWISSRPMDNWHQKYLTLEERQWLEHHKVWRVGVDPESQPLDFFDASGRHAGLASDYIKFIANALDVELVYQPDLSWSETIDRIKQQQLDVLAMAGKTSQRENFLGFTDPYIRFPIVIITRIDNATIKSQDDLSGKRIALVNSYPVTEIIINSDLNFRTIPSSTIEEALKNVSNNKADAAIIDIATASYKMNQLNLNNLMIAAYSNYQAPDFSVAVRKDWQPLVPIINKVLATISIDQKLMFSNHWFSLSPNIEGNQNFHRVSYQTTEWMSGYVIALTLLLLAMLVSLCRYVFISKEYENFRSFNRSKIIKVAIAFNGILISLVTLMAWYALAEIKSHVLQQSQESLQTILKTTNRSLTIWIQNQKKQIKNLSASTPIIELAKQQIKSRESETDWQQSNALHNLRQRFSQLSRISGHQGFFIISPEGYNLASMRDFNLGKQNIIYQQQPELFFRALQGETIWVPPVASDLNSTNEYENDIGITQSTMFVMTPLLDERGKVFALLTLRFDPYGEFRETLELGQISNSGETFVFDRTARLLSPSRFEKQLIDMGLINDEQQSILNIQLVVPDSATQKAGDKHSAILTVLAQHGVNQQFGYDMRGYTNYRGKTVIGAWQWNSEFNVGLATEMELKEALEPYLNARYFFLLILMITLLVAATLSTFIVILGARTTQQMRKTNELLELKVEKRTRDLKDKEARLRSLFESSGEAIVIFDGTKLIDVNRAALALFEVQDKKSLVVNGVNKFIINNSDQSTEQYLDENLKRTLKKSIVRLEAWLKTYNDRAFEAEIIFTLVPLDEGHLIQAIIRDISKQKEYEASLEHAREQAESANIAKSRFLANMSHEIRTPMNGVLSLARLMRETPLNDEQKNYIKTIEQCGKSLLMIINSILDFSKIEAGKLELSENNFDLLNFSRNIHDMFSIDAEQKFLDLILDTKDIHSKDLIGDELRLSQILINLIGNAIKFTNKGRVTIRIHQQAVINNTVNCIFEVIDTGIGMADQVQSKLFKSFTQADSSTTREYGGTGLGLAICKELTNLLEGHINVKSILGKGTHFTVMLPFKVNTGVIPDASENANTLLNASSSLDNTRILVVEDNSVNQLIARKFLEKHGAKVKVTENGAKAITAVKENRYDLILMDIQMPVLDGTEATKEIRKHFTKEQLPIIALSANVMQNDVNHYIEIGMNDHVGKPIDFELLLLKLKFYLGR